MSFDTANANDLARLALVASDASYAGNSLLIGAPLAPFLDSSGPEILCPYDSEITSSGYRVIQSFQDNATGFKAVAFRNDTTDDTIVAFAGTDGLELKDWWANSFYYGWNQWELNRNSVFLLLNNILDPDGSGTSTGKIHFTGQSLGGALAQYAAYEYIVERKAVDSSYLPSDLTLTTFNALGGVAALKEQLGAAFDHDLVSGMGAIAHYRTPNDIVSRLGEGHLGADVVYELPFRPGSINPLTNRLTEYELVTTHRIESGFYQNLRESDGWFAQARRALPESGYLLIPNLQKVASYFGNPFKTANATSPEALIELSSAVLYGAITAPANETNGLIWALADSQFNAEVLSEDEYWRIRRTDWGKTAKLWAGVVTIANPLALVTTWIGTIILGRLASGFGLSFGEASNSIKSEYDAATNALPVPERSPSVGDIQFEVIQARLMEDGDSVLRSAGFADNLDPEALAQALQSDGNWERQYLSYLYDAAAHTNAPKEEKLRFVDVAIAEFLDTARSAADKDAALRSEVGQTIAQFVTADLYPAVANLNPDLAANYPTLLSFGQASGFPELQRSIDAARQGLERIGVSLASLLSGTAEAAVANQRIREAQGLIESAGQTVVLRQGRTPNPFDSPDFDPDASPLALGALSEGAVRTFTVYLPYAAGAGGQRIELALAGSAADRLSLLDRADEAALGPDGRFTLAVPEGRRELSFGLWAKADIDADATLELSAQLVDGSGEATHLEHIELNLALAGSDETPPVTTREIRGDWTAKPWVDPATGITYDHRFDELGNVERLPDVPSTVGWEPDGQLDGSGGADHIVTGDYDDSVVGWAGDDFIVGSDRAGNILYAGEGDDRIEGGTDAYHEPDSFREWEYLGRTIRLGDDKIYGGAGDDQIWGESEATQAALDEASPALPGFNGDWISGGTGYDAIYGSRGDDVLLGGVGEDLLAGGAGMDVLLGDDDFQLRPDGNFWRVIHPSFGDATLGFGGFEVGLFPVINATLAYPDLLWSVSGDPYFTYYKNGGGDDVLVGGAGGDILLGQHGNDALYGGEGDDILAGWEGDDELVGGAGNDLMAGDFGRYEQTNQRPLADVQLVTAGVLGSPGAYGSAPALIGNDLLDGGAGDDVLYGEGGGDALLGGDGDDALYGDANYLPEDLHGDDVIDGGEGDDTLDGGAGDDALYGGAGDDALVGGRGDDLLEGESGDDILSGGDGDDTYVVGFGHGRDVIEDAQGSNRIRAAAGLAPGDVLIQRTEFDLLVGVRDGTTGIAIRDWFAGDASRLAGMEFAGGTFWDADEMEARLELAPGTPQDDEIFGTGGNDIIDAGAGDDYVYEEGHALVIGGAGDDWVDHYGNGGVIAFNPGDGDDTVYAAGALTLSIGGGVRPGDLALGQDGDDLVLDVAGAGSIRLMRPWDDGPAAWPRITLQLFGSVHLYDFNAAIDALGLPLGEVLAANEIWFSETDGIGGAIAWQYATAGSTAALSSAQLDAVRADPGFGVAPQPIAFEKPNRPPRLAQPVLDQAALEDAPFALSVATVFADPDAGDALGYRAALADGSPLPAWLGFDAASAAFAGTPGNGDVGTLQIALTATDAEGKAAADAFVLEVVNANDAPYLAQPIAPQAGREGETLAFSIAGAFADVDAGDSLAYAATLGDGSALPAWLAFDPANAAFAAAPGLADGGDYLVRVTATDAAGASAQAEFTLSILESEPACDPGVRGHHGHDNEAHHHRGHPKEHGRHDKHERDDRDLPCGRLARLPQFDFEAIVRELERGKPHEAALSPAEIRQGWERVARHAAELGAGDDDALGAPWHGAGDFLRLASGGGQGFGFEASVGAGRGQEDFKSFEGLREGFRRL